MSRRIRAVLVLSSAMALPLRAQTPASALADTIMQLNRAGHLEQAGGLAQRALGTNASAEDKCAFRIGGVYALTHLGLFDSAVEELKVVDAQCAQSAVTRQQAADLASIRRALTLPPLPKTGMDFSSIDQFWKVADLLATDRLPSEDDWHSLLGSVGYRLSEQVVPTTRSDMEIALRPLHRAEFDSLTKLPGDQAARLRHFAAAYTHRAALAKLRDSLTRSLPVQEGTAGAAKFLPPHATDGVDPPLVAFAIFRDDGYSLGSLGVIVDLDHLLDNPLTPLLAHEFHHSYLSMVTRVARPAGDSPDGPLMQALIAMRNEGIADLIDKPYPLAFTNNAAMIAYSKRYNEAYARTPAVLHSIDSLLVIAADDSTQLRVVGRRVSALLPSSGHFNGSYVAREVYETFGIDSLYPGVASPMALLRTYAAAEAKRGNPPPFSPKAMALLGALEKKYWR